MNKEGSVVSSSKAMAKVLLFLVAGFGCLMHDVRGATSNGKVYYRTTVTSENLTSSSVSEVVSVNSLIGCAQEANKRSWCHLICYDGQECSLYDVMIPRIHNITTASTDKCWTDTEVLPCPANFVVIEGAGCLYVNTQLGTMATADTFCKSIKSRLVIPKDVAALTAFAKKLTPLEKYYWVGIKDGKWMDGTAVLDSQMGRTGYGPIPCAYLHEAVGYGIIGYGCDFSMPSICQYIG